MNNDNLEDFLQQLNARMNAEDPIDDPIEIEFDKMNEDDLARVDFDSLMDDDEISIPSGRESMTASLEQIFDSNFDGTEDAVTELKDGEKAVAMALTDIAFKKISPVASMLVTPLAKSILLQAIALVIQMFKFIEITPEDDDDDDFEDDDLEDYPY